MMRFGWRKDPYDHRDYLQAPIKVALPDSVDLSVNLPEVRDQSNEGSCVGFGIGGIVTATAKQRNAFTEWFSPRWIYNGARFLEGRLSDEGAYPRDGFDWLLKKGCLLERFWPYVAGQDSAMPPPSSLDPRAAERPLLSYARVDNGVEGICSALASGKYVAIGAPWFESWMTPDEHGLVKPVSRWDTIAGGHEFFAWGYVGYSNPDTGYVACQNSWSPSWGKDGRFYVPMQAVKVWKQTQGYDAHTVEINWSEVVRGIKMRLQRSLDGGQSWSDLWSE